MSNSGYSRLDADIACINTHDLPSTLISTTGFHCNVWRATPLRIVDGKRTTVDVIIKQHIRSCDDYVIRMLYRDYKMLRNALGYVVPEATFISTCIDGTNNVLVIAEPVKVWFNLANPSNEEEAIPLLQRYSRARGQLRRFIHAADEWYNSPDMRVIDLWGLDNLVLDSNRHVRYIDSFRVFFYADLLHSLDNVDDDLRERIEVSIERLKYLKYILAEAEATKK
jgi:hypothetical protein